MNIIFSKSPLSSRAVPSPITRIKISGLLFLGTLAIWMQGSSLSRAQDTSTNSAPLTVIDESSTNLPPVSETNSSATLPIEGFSANGPSILPQDAPPSASDTISPAPNSDAASTDNSPPTLGKAAKLYAQGEWDSALTTVNAVLDKEPKNLNVYILRGAINAQKQAWDQAEKDYETALQMDPKNDGVRYDMADLKFKEKQFNAARAAFVPLQDNKNPNISDLIAYKIYLCDLFEGRDDAASKELDLFNQSNTNASYYFGNAAWDLVHKKTEDARGWLVSASHIYPPRKQLVYAYVLKDMGYLPLPPSP